jgi:hypothetical protein
VTVALLAPHALLERDAETALGVLTSQQGVQHRLAAGLISAERGAETSEIPVTEMACAVVRLAVSFVVVGEDIQVSQGVGDGWRYVWPLVSICTRVVVRQSKRPARFVRIEGRAPWGAVW